MLTVKHVMPSGHEEIYSAIRAGATPVTAAMLASGLDTPPEVLALFFSPQAAHNARMSSRIIGNVTDTSPCEMIPYQPVDVSFTAQDYFAPESDPA